MLQLYFFIELTYWRDFIRVTIINNKDYLNEIFNYVFKVRKSELRRNIKIQ